MIPRWTRFTTEDGLADNDVYDVAVGPDGAKWFATSRGVSRLSAGGNWMTYREDGLASDYVQAVAVDGENNKWFATPNGVSLLSAEGDWTTYSMDDGLPADSVSAIAVDAYNNVWVGVRRRYVYGYGYVGSDALVVRSAEDGTWTTYTTANGMASNRVSAIAAAPGVDVWVGHPGAGVSRFSDGDWITYGSETLPGGYVSEIAIAPSGEVWVVIEDGISVYSPDSEEEWTNYPLESTPWLGDSVTASAFEPDGDVWIGFEEAGAVWRAADGNEWKAYGQEDGLGSNRVRAIAIDRAGDVWFATEEWEDPGCYHRSGPGLASLVQWDYFIAEGGVTRYHPPGRRVLWQATVAVGAGGDLPGLVEEVWSLTASSLGATGKLYLEGDLRAISGQELAADRQPFYVFDTDTALTMNPDRTIYRPGQAAIITGQVRNGSPDTLEAQSLTVRLGAEQVTVGPFDVPPGGAYPYNVSCWMRRTSSGGRPSTCSSGWRTPRRSI
jgi:hypothetical protein